MTLKAQSDRLTLVEHTDHVKASTLALVRSRGVWRSNTPSKIERFGCLLMGLSDDICEFSLVA